MYNRYILILLVVGLTTHGALSQTQKIGYFGPEKVIVKLDPLSNIADTAFPYDRYFYIRRYYKDDPVVVKNVFITEPIFFRKKYSKNVSEGLKQASEALDIFPAKSDVTDAQPAFTKAIDILVPPLQPRSTYDLVFSYPMSFDRREEIADALLAYYNNEVMTAKRIICDINEEKKQQFDSGIIDFDDFVSYYDQQAKSVFLAIGPSPLAFVSPSIRNTLIASLDKGGELVNLPAKPAMGLPARSAQLFLDMETLLVSGTEAFKLETRAAAKVQPDFGALFYGLGGTGDVGVNKDFVGITPYVGFSFMVRSFDADIPIRFVKHRISSLQRLSFHCGVTLFSLAKDNYREDLFNKNNLILGLGYRLTSALKVQGGVILYKKRKDANPLYTDTMTAPIGYFGLSLDLRIKNILGDIGKFLFGS